MLAYVSIRQHIYIAYVHIVGFMLCLSACVLVLCYCLYFTYCTTQEPAVHRVHAVPECWCAGLFGVCTARQVLHVLKYLFDQYKSTNTGRAAAREGLMPH